MLSKVKENTLAKAIVMKGKTCPALQELMQLKEDESSWLYKANLLRNLGAHRKEPARKFFVGGEHDGEVSSNLQIIIMLLFDGL
jgi:hypothetical protein